MGLGPPAVVGLERALAHSWAPGPEGIGGADLSASGENWWARTTHGRRLPMGEGSRCSLVARAAAASVVETGKRYGRPPPPVKRDGRPSRRCPRAPVGPGISDIGGATRETRHSRRSDAVEDRDTPRSPGRIVPTGEKFSGGLWTTACCGSAALLASRRSHSLSILRSTSPVALAVCHPGLLAGRAGRLVVSTARGHRTKRGNLCTQAVDDHVDGRPQASLVHRGFPPVTP